MSRDWKSGLLTVIGLALLLSCTSKPDVEKTGRVLTVLIADRLFPAELAVKPGDEVRWLNRRQGDIKVIFLNPILDQLVCQHGLATPLGRGSGNEIPLSPNDSASLCFSKPGAIRYTVKLDHPLATGEFKTPGIILVEERRTG